MKTQPETSFDTMISEDDLNYKEETITMQCTNCGYEEEMPAWCYGEEADYLEETNDSEPPCWQCPKCYHETLYRRVNQPLIFL